MCQTYVAESGDFGMNTEIIYKVLGVNAQEALNFGKRELARLENRLSRFIQVFTLKSFIKKYINL